jgi:hypothetical protein
VTSQPDAVRILIPDHPDLNVGGAVSFTAEMRDTADPATYETGAEPWTLPDTLTTPALATAMEAILLPWGYDVGDESRDTAIDLHHAGVQHMGVYVATATREQLDQLTAARDVMASATNTPPSQRSPADRETAEFVDAYNDATGDDEVSLRAWNVMLDLFVVATATTPTSTHRPERLLDERGKLVRQPDPAGTSPAADTATLLARIDVTGARPVELSEDEYDAYRRLTVEWHTAIYRDKADTADTQLTSLIY